MSPRRKFLLGGAAIPALQLPIVRRGSILSAAGLMTGLFARPASAKIDPATALAALKIALTVVSIVQKALDGSKGPARNDVSRATMTMLAAIRQDLNALNALLHDALASLERIERQIRELPSQVLLRESTAWITSAQSRFDQLAEVRESVARERGDVEAFNVIRADAEQFVFNLTTTHADRLMSTVRGDAAPALIPILGVAFVMEHTVARWIMRDPALIRMRVNHYARWFSEQLDAARQHSVAALFNEVRAAADRNRGRDFARTAYAECVTGERRVQRFRAHWDMSAQHARINWSMRSPLGSAEVEAMIQQLTDLGFFTQRNRPRNVELVLPPRETWVDTNRDELEDYNRYAARPRCETGWNEGFRHAQQARHAEYVGVELRLAVLASQLHSARQTAGLLREIQSA